MTVLVLGGAGYIGSHAVHELLREGEDVAVIDNLQTGHREAVPANARFYEGDVRNRSFLDAVFSRENVDTVMHFAACSLVAESVSKPLLYYDNNLHAALVLLESMLAHNVRRIIFSSTAATYGNAPDRPILESDETKPTNPYGETKLAMEKMIAWTADAADLHYVSLRYFNAAGAAEHGGIGEDHNPESHLIPLILRVANGKARDISVYGTDYATADGTCIRDYIHVVDLARAHILAMRYLAAGGQSDIFNLGTGAGFSVNEVIESARRITGHAIPAIAKPRRAGDPPMLVASGLKAQRILGFTPSLSGIDTILETAWKWHSIHPEGFSSSL